MKGKTRGEARDELMKSGVTGDRLNKIIPHKVSFKHTLKEDGGRQHCVCVCVRARAFFMCVCLSGKEGGLLYT